MSNSNFWAVFSLEKLYSKREQGINALRNENVELGLGEGKYKNVGFGVWKDGIGSRFCKIVRLLQVFEIL
jgi:hypothetical protein